MASIKRTHNKQLVYLNRMSCTLCNQKALFKEDNGSGLLFCGIQCQETLYIGVDHTDQERLTAFLVMLNMRVDEMLKMQRVSTLFRAVGSTDKFMTAYTQRHRIQLNDIIAKHIESPSKYKDDFIMKWYDVLTKEMLIPRSPSRLLYIAIRHNNAKYAAFLVHRGGKADISVLRYAVKENNLRMITVLTNDPDVNPYTALLQASESHKNDIFEFLLHDYRIDKRMPEIGKDILTNIIASDDGNMMEMIGDDKRIATSDYEEVLDNYENHFIPRRKMINLKKNIMLLERVIWKRALE